jgi:hypothetical protein
MPWQIGANVNGPTKGDRMSADLAAKLLTLLTLAEVWRKMRNDEEVARCHAEMRALLEGCVN